MSTELAWAAGFIDGEGCFHLVGKVNRRGVKKHRFALAASQSDDRPLKRLSLAVGHGNVHGPYNHTKDPLRKKVTYQWSVSGAHAWRIYNLLLPYLSEPKKEQAEKCLNVLTEVDRDRLVRLSLLL